MPATKVDLAVLEVEHHGERKMVGKLVLARSEHYEREVFLHVHTVTQHHTRSGCPSPVDAAVLRWLRDRGIGLMFAYEQDTETLRIAGIKALLEAPGEISDGRLRHYLAERDWPITVKGVREIRGDKGRRSYITAAGRVVAETPYLKKTILIDDGKGDS